MFEETHYETKNEASPESCANLAVIEATNKISSDFEGRENEKENLPFHNSLHTGHVAERVGLILETIGEANPELVSAKTKSLGKIAASFHDIIQGWEEREIPDGQFSKIIRSRFAGKNEEASANLAIKFIERANAQNNGEIFSKEDAQIVREAIQATVPGFNAKKETVVQPNLNEKSSVVARALALADIGTAGVDGPETFLKEGDALFKEENLDILEASKKDSNGIPENLKNYYRQRMINWSNFQPKFAQGRKELIEIELNGLPEQSKKKLRTLFNKFDASIEAAKQKATSRTQMPFEELLIDMKFK